MQKFRKIQIKEFGNVITGSTPSTTIPDFWDGDIPFYSPADITDAAYCYKTEKKITNLGLKQGRTIPINSIMVTCIASIGKIAINSKEGLTNQQINTIIANEGFDYKYIYYLLSQNILKLANTAPQTAVPIVNKSEFEKFEVFGVKDINQQINIAKILSTCDEVIEKTEDTIEKYKKIKTGMMQDLFTRGLDENGKLRPKYEEAPDLYKYSAELEQYIPKDWDVKPLSHFILELVAGVSVNSEDKSSMSQVAVLKTSCVSNGVFFPNENKIVIEKDIHRVKMNPQKNSIIISRMNTPLLVGECGYVDKDYPMLFLPDRLWQTVFSTQNEVDVPWLNYLLNTDEYKKKIKDKATGTSNSMKNITKDDFLNTLIFVPKPPEQQNIAKFLYSIDQNINSEMQILNKYKQIKQGLMKKLLTPPDDAEIIEV